MKIGDFCFPEESWFDFLFMVLPDWNLKLIKMLNEGSKREVIGFVDGNYAAQFVESGEGFFNVTFGRWDQVDDVFYKEEVEDFQVSIRDFVKTLTVVNLEVLKRADKEAVSSEYLETLKDWASKLVEAQKPLL